MKGIIIYATKNGCTEKAVRLLQAKLPEGVKAVNLENEKAPDLSSIDTVIIGCPIYVGKTLRIMTDFVQQNHEILKSKNMALFVCAGEQDTARSQKLIASTYTEELYHHAIIRESFGGELHWDKLDFITRIMLRLVKGIKEGYFRLSEEKIDQFARCVLQKNGIR